MLQNIKITTTKDQIVYFDVLSFSIYCTGHRLHFLMTVVSGHSLSHRLIGLVHIADWLQGLFLANFIAVIGLHSQCQKVSFFPILGGKFPNLNKKKKSKKIIIFISVKVGLKLWNVQHCTVSSCNGYHKLRLQLNSDKYMMYFMI